MEHGGLLSSNRGSNLPGRHVSLPSLTEKDLADVELAIAHGLDPEELDPMLQDAYAAIIHADCVLMKAFEAHYQADPSAYAPLAA